MKREDNKKEYRFNMLNYMLNEDSGSSIALDGLIGFVCGPLIGTSDDIPNFTEKRVADRIMSEGRSQEIINDAKYIMEAGKSNKQYSKNYRTLNTLIEAYESETDKTSGTAKSLLGRIAGQLAIMENIEILMKFRDSKKDITECL